MAKTKACWHLMSVPGVGPIPGVGVLSATVIAATTPDVDNFDCARDYAAWLGLMPKPHSTGGK